VCVCVAVSPCSCQVLCCLCLLCCAPPPTCLPRYGVTHSGLDAMVVRYIEEMDIFAKLPDDLAYVNHTS
jgi:hypothetical protein